LPEFIEFVHLPLNAIVLSDIKMKLFEIILPARPKYLNSKTFCKSSLIIYTASVTGEISNYESALPNF